MKPRIAGGFLADAAGALFRTARKNGDNLPTKGPAKALKNADYSPDQLRKILRLLTYKFDNGCGESFYKAAGDLEMITLQKRTIPDPERFTVAVHGNPRVVGIGKDAYTADDLGTFLESPYSSWNGETIRLTSCNTGNTSDTDNPFAQQLADRLGVTVRAPDKYSLKEWDGTVASTSVRFDADGNPIITRPPDGEFIDFHPKPRP